MAAAKDQELAQSGFGALARSVGARAWPSPLLAAVMAAVSAVLGYFLLYDDLNLQYPFMFPDSYDWVANGLHYAGHPVFYSVRPPGLPLIMAALIGVDALRLLPLVNLAVGCGVVMVCYHLWRGDVTREAALIAAALVFASYFFLSLAFYVLADLYCLLFIALSLREYVNAAESPHRYVTSALFLGISFAFQYAGINLLPPYAVIWMLHRYRQRAWRHLALAAVTFTATLVPWPIYRWITFGDPLYSHVIHGELVRFHLGSIPFYLFNTVGAIGVAASALGLVGLAATARRRLGERALLMLLVLASNVVFWVLLYDWNDRRFVLYWLIPVYYLVARGVCFALTSVPEFRWRPVGVAAVALALALYANLDCGSPLSVDRIALSPWHQIVAPAIAKGPGLDIDVTAMYAERVARRAVDSLAVTKPMVARTLSKERVHSSDLAQARALLRERYPDGYRTVWLHFGTGELRSWYALRNRYGNALLTTLKPIGSLADVPSGEPTLMLKPYDDQVLTACEVLWEGSDEILLVTHAKREGLPISRPRGMGRDDADHDYALTKRWSRRVEEMGEPG